MTPTRTDVLPTVASEFAVVGKSVAHADFIEKVRGALPYADDWRMPGMLHGRVVRAQIPCGRILSLDTEQARAVPGVAVR